MFFLRRIVYFLRKAVGSIRENPFINLITVGTIATEPIGAPINGATTFPTSIGNCHQRSAHAFTPSVFHDSYSKWVESTGLEAPGVHR